MSERTTIGQRTRVPIALAVGALLALAALAVVLIIRSDDPAGEPAGQPAEAAPSAPASWEDLPPGGEPRIAYVVGRTLYLANGQQATFRARPFRFVERDGTALVHVDEGPIVLVRETEGAAPQTTELAPRGFGPAMGPGEVYSWAAEDAEVGTAQVQIGDSQVTLPFPDAHPSCCDNPFYAYGVTDQGWLIAGVPAMESYWAWDLRLDAADEKGPHPAARPRVLTGIPEGAHVLDLDAEPSGPRLELADGRIVEATVVKAGHEARLARLKPALATDTEPQAVAETRFLLPPEAWISEVWWEDDHTALVSASTTGRDHLVRCSLPSGACELIHPSADRYSFSHRNLS